MILEYDEWSPAISFWLAVDITWEQALRFSRVGRLFQSLEPQLYCYNGEIFLPSLLSTVQECVSLERHT